MNKKEGVKLINTDISFSDMHKKKRWFININDKKGISRIRCCPPHHIPHKLPFGEKISDEKCHIHKSKWRMIHHTFFCKYLKCLNYKFMIKKHKKII